MRILALLILFSTTAFADEIKFEDYPQNVIFKGKPAKVDFSSSPSYKTFVTRLTSGAASGPNFAGSFTIVSWGCGSNCENITIISAKNGKILGSLVSCGDHAFKLNSNLLIVNPPGSYLAFAPGCVTEYYQLSVTKLEKIILKNG